MGVYFPPENRFFSWEREDHPRCNSTPALRLMSCVRVKASRRQISRGFLLLSSASDMDNSGKAPDEAERDEEGNSLDWLLLKERSEVIVPMDTNVPLQR